MKKYLIEFDIGLLNAFGGSLELLTEDEYQMLLSFISDGTSLYFGEIEGKHSEIYGPLGREDYRIISTDPEEIKYFGKLFGTQYGAIDVLYTMQEYLDGR